MIAYGQNRVHYIVVVEYQLARPLPKLGVHNLFDPRPSRPASLTTRSAEIEDVFELPAGLLQIGPSAPTRDRNRAISSNCGSNRSLLPYSKEYMDVCSLVLISFHDHLV